MMIQTQLDPKILPRAFLLSLFASLAFVQQANATGCGCWVPSAGAGYHVASVVYDFRSQLYPSGNYYPAGINAQIQVILKEEITSSTSYTSRFFYFNTGDAAQVTKANAIYSSLLTAKTTGEFVSLSIDGSGPASGVGASGSIAAVQLGGNPGL